MGFFASGIEASATSTREQMLSLVHVQTALKVQVRASSLRADSAHAAVDFAVGHPIFSNACGAARSGPPAGVEQLVDPVWRRELVCRNRISKTGFAYMLQG